MKSTLVVNLFGGPGTGKSTTAAGVFHLLKRRGINCELVTEYAKDLTWEQRYGALAVQPYVFGKQLMRLERLIGQVDVIVTDSPILLSVVYSSKKYPVEFTQSVFQIFTGMNNLNFFLQRKKEYNPNGRSQTLKEAVHIDKKINELLVKCRIPYLSMDADEQAHINIANCITAYCDCSHES